jgi:hypothetical protein
MKEIVTEMLQNTNHAHVFAWSPTLAVNEQKNENEDSINVFRQNGRMLQYDGL